MIKFSEQLVQYADSSDTLSAITAISLLIRNEQVTNEQAYAMCMKRWNNTTNVEDKLLLIVVMDTFNLTFTNNITEMKESLSDYI